jgi:UDP-glucose 4-epimerase
MFKKIIFLLSFIIQGHVLHADENEQKYILVTGGAGYIGSHVCKALSTAGFSPVVYDNLSTGHETYVKWGTFERGDILDIKRLEGVFSAYSFIGVCHFAAKISVPESCNDPLEYYETNVTGTLNVLKCIKKYAIKAFVFSSTCTVFGQIDTTCAVDEETPYKDITNPYAQTKKTVEEMLKWHHQAHGTPYACLRYFNVAGADAAGELFSPNSAHIIPMLIKQLQSDKPFTLYGTDYNTKDGTCVRDYIHVSDLADAHVKAMHYLLSKKQPLTLCLGSGKGYTNLEVLQMVEKVSGQKVPYEKHPRRAGDLESIYANYTKAQELLGWSPRMSLEDIVRTAMMRL